MPAAFTIRLDDETLEALDRLAEQTDRTRSALASRAIKEFVALNQWQVAKTEAGIAAAERRDFAAEDEVTRLRGKYARRT